MTSEEYLQRYDAIVLSAEFGWMTNADKVAELAELAAEYKMSSNALTMTDAECTMIEELKLRGDRNATS